MKIAIPTDGEKGLKDTVSQVFARAPYFTIIDLDGKSPKVVEILENEAAKLTQGAGPIAASILKDKDVNMILSCEVGPGVKTILNLADIGIKKVTVGEKVRKVLNEFNP